MNSPAVSSTNRETFATPHTPPIGCTAEDRLRVSVPKRSIRFELAQSNVSRGENGSP